uniref:methylenetetrahydrofolate reductase n=1 Tax=Sandarakinorhabdus rubra TaxID=2672568 RepID=UPI001969D49E
MTALTLNQMAEAARALNSPLFADLPGDLQVSFEFFPPKTPAMQESLWQAVETLVPLGPRFFSVTYGAGGSTRERTHATVARIALETPVAAAAHLTCVNATADELETIADDYWAAGVRHIVALRGDPPADPAGGPARFAPVPG